MLATTTKITPCCKWESCRMYLLCRCPNIWGYSHYTIKLILKHSNDVCVLNGWVGGLSPYLPMRHLIKFIQIVLYNNTFIPQNDIQLNLYHFFFLFLFFAVYTVNAQSRRPQTIARSLGKWIISTFEFIAVIPWTLSNI